MLLIILKKPNKSIMKPRKIGGTLDNFVVSNITSPQEESLPTMRTINLKEESLKTKGVKKRRKG